MLKKITNHRLLGSLLLVCVVLISAGVVFNFGNGKGLDHHRKMKKHLSAWLWKDAGEYDILKLRRLFSRAKERDVSLVYLNVEHYLDLWDLDKRDQQEIEHYEFILSNFIDEAEKFGIKVEALAGNPLWGRPDYWYLPLELDRFIGEFNLKNPKHKFSGVQFNIEFYNDREGISEQDFGGLVEVLASRKSDVRLGFTVPYNVEATSRREWSKVEASLRESERKVYIVPLTYRNNVREIVEIATPFFENVELEKIPIILAVETNNVEPEKITYFAKTYEELNRNLDEVYGAFRNYKNFSGVAVHDLEGFLLLKD